MCAADVHRGRGRSLPHVHQGRCSPYRWQREGHARGFRPEPRTADRHHLDLPAARCVEHRRLLGRQPACRRNRGRINRALQHQEDPPAGRAAAPRRPARRSRPASHHRPISLCQRRQRSDSRGSASGQPAPNIDEGEPPSLRKVLPDEGQRCLARQVLPPQLPQYGLVHRKDILLRDTLAGFAREQSTMQY